MMYRDFRSSRRAAVLIVVVGILAVLSLIAVTFGMLMIVESAASRNQTEHEMARQAAHAALEYMLTALEAQVGGTTFTSGTLPDFCPNPNDPFGCQELYKRGGLKVYFALHSHTADDEHVDGEWIQGLGNEDAGMFNINAMGFEGDLGSNCNYDIRYTSFECSLVRLLKSRFDAADSEGRSGEINTFRSNSGSYPTFADGDERQRVAILAAAAIVGWRHSDGFPGTEWVEEHRLGHLPRWSHTIGCTVPVNAGVGYPNNTDDKYEWGWDDGLPSFYLGRTANISDDWCYVEPDVWCTNYNNSWQDDIGVAPSGEAWGKISAPPAGPAPYTITADDTRAGWRDWATDRWANAYLYIANGRGKGWFYQINSNGSKTLVLLSAGAYSTGGGGADWSSYPERMPQAGDAFAICPQLPTSATVVHPYAIVGADLTRNRWEDSAPPHVHDAGDLVPTALLWPDGTLATETGVADLVIDSGTVSGAADNQIQDHAKSWTNDQFNDDYIVHIYAGHGRGQVRRIQDTEVVVLDSGTAESGTDTTLTDSDKSWTDGEFVGKVIRILAGTGAGQWRTITGNGATSISIGVGTPWSPAPDATSQYRIEDLPPPTLTLYTNWAVTPDTTSRYRIELPNNHLPSKYHPDDLQGDDRAYLSLGDLRDSVVVPALAADGLSLSDAQGVADILIPYFQKYLSVSNRAATASQEMAAINDWAVDGVDNDGNGVMDDEFPTSSELAKHLYERLGLKLWAHSVSGTDEETRVKQAAQVVANIIDFRDGDDIPTELSQADLGESAPTFTVYGAEGLHVTEVMPTPDEVVSTDGSQLDPLTQTFGNQWDWDADHWTSASTNAGGEWTFINIADAANADGWYAVRLKGNSGQTLYFNVGADTVPVSIEANGYGYVRYDDSVVPFPAEKIGKLYPVQVTGDSLTFRITGTSGGAGEVFYGFQLLAQYVEVTNVSAHDIDVAGWRLTTDQGQLTLPSENDVRLIPGASADGIFPINYGTYVVAMSEEAYEKQWGADASGEWGDIAGEDYPVWFAGDGTDADANALLLGSRILSYSAGTVTVTEDDPDVTATPGTTEWLTYVQAGNRFNGPNGVEYVIQSVDSDERITLSQNYGGADASVAAYVIYGTRPRIPIVELTDAGATVIAGRVVDGDIPEITDPADCYSSVEKTKILQPTWDTATSYWVAYQSSPTQLSGSQNAQVTVQADALRGPADNTAIRSCLNLNLTDIWTTYPTLQTASILAGASQVFPIILNRPYPTTGWLGLVPTSNDPWRTIDPDDSPSLDPTVTPSAPEKLLGTLMSNATVGGVYARININTAPEDILKTVFTDGESNAIIAARDARLSVEDGGSDLATDAWANWDEVLNDSFFQNADNDFLTPAGIGFYDDPEATGISNDDSGAGTYADDFPDDSDEKEEWARRFGNLFDLRSTAFRFIVAGLVYEDTDTPTRPVAQVRIEVDVDMSGGDIRMVHFRYLSE